ncbi:hypothetical protein OOZ51_14540 [Arthrobacter sp. MI7-26]|uniref:hypothetical protein n=1 Tax=Arthrobacter sp. MI7-26 TaxID=2993653 RepID=UPI0022495A3E|nr:hypothetical protein [Arthrobacter sp. MI7-26]MCX2749024.1 hypothetical protein [Arthrobacter sp. MI7-26]
MISTIEAGRTFFVEANNPLEIEHDLNAAVDAALMHAMQDGRHGILVTRHGHSSFTVAVSSKVPYGETMEENGPAWSPGKAENSGPS